MNEQTKACRMCGDEATAEVTYEAWMNHPESKRPTVTQVTCDRHVSLHDLMLSSGWAVA